MKKRRFHINGTYYNVPENEADAFLSDNPHAEEVRKYDIEGKTYNIPLQHTEEFETDMGLKKKVGGDDLQNGAPKSGTNYSGLSNGKEVFSFDKFAQPEAPDEYANVNKPERVFGIGFDRKTHQLQKVAPNEIVPNYTGHGTPNEDIDPRHLTPLSVEEANNLDKNVLGNIWNHFTAGVGKLSAGAIDLTSQLLAKVTPNEDGQTDEDKLKYLRENVVEPTRTATTELVGANVTPDQKRAFDKGFITTGLGGLAEMIPALGGKGSGMILQAYDSGLESINNTEFGKQLPENDKTIFAATVGTTVGLMNMLALDKIFGKQTSKVASEVATNVLGKLIKEQGENITAEMTEKAITAELRSLRTKVFDGSIRVGKGAVIGGLVGAAQESANILAEKILNKAEGKQIFEEQSWKENLSRIANATAANGIGGAILGGISAPFNKTRNYISEKVAEAKSPEDIVSLKEELRNSHEGGKLSTEEIGQLNSLVDDYVRVNSKVPDTVPNRKEAVEKIMEREDVQNEISKKQDELQNVDEAFQPEKIQEINALQNKANEINEEILNPSENEQATETQTQKDATPKKPESTENTTEEKVENKSLNLQSNEGNEKNISTGQNKSRTDNTQASPEKEKSLTAKFNEVSSTSDIIDPYDRALQYFAGEGKIHPYEVERVFDGKGDKAARIGLIKNSAPNIDKLAHDLWENDKSGKFDTQDYVNAIERVLTDYTSKSAMQKDFVERYDFETAAQKYYEQFKEPEAKEAIDKVSAMSDDEINHLLQLDADKASEQEIQDFIDNKGNKAEPPVIEPPKEGVVDNGNKDANTMGVSHKSLTDLAKKLGLKEPERGQRLTPEEYANRGRALLNSGADVAELEQKFKDGKQPTANDISVARAHLEDLTKIADAMKDKWGKDSKQFADANKEVDRWVTEVVKPMGTAASEPFTALQGERDLDTDSFVTVKRTLEDATGKPVSKVQEKKIDELTTQNNILKKQSDDLESKVIEETDKTIGGKPKEKAAKKTHDQYVKERAVAFQAARDALKNLRTGQSGLGVTVPLVRELAAIAPHITKIVSSLIEEGVDKLGDIVDTIHDELSKDMLGLRRRDVMDLIAGEYNKDKAATASSKLADIRKQSRLVKQLEDLQEGLPEDFDKNKTEQSPEVKALLEKIKKVKDDLDAMGYMKEPKKELTDEEKRLASLRKQIDDLIEGNFSQKNGKPVYKFTKEQEQEIIKLQDEIDKLKKSKGLIKGNAEKPLTEQEQIDADAKELEDIQKKFVDKKDNKFTPDESKTIWDYAKKNYLDKGVSYIDMISQVKNDLGLSWKQVSGAITSPKLKPISDAMWKKQYDYRKNQIATKNWVEAQSSRLPLKGLRKISSAVRGVAVFGHGGIFIGTHAGMTLFSPSQWRHVIPAFIRGWKFAYGNKANYVRRIEELKNSQNYVVAQRAGLKNNPDIVNAEEFQKSQKFFEKIGGEAGTKGFNAIKVLRQDLFDDHYNRLSAAEKADPEAAESVAKLVNLATGATNLKIPEAINEITFAGGMEAARWGKLTRSPIKATGTALKALFTPDKVSVADKVFAKVWARRVGEQIGTMASLLVANAAIQGALNPKNPTNLTDPNKQDYLKFKFGDITIDPTSGMRGAAMFAYGVGKIPFMDKKQLRGDTRMQALGKNAIGYGRGKLAPLYSTFADFFAQQDFNRNPLPFSDDKPAPGHHKLTWLEYGFEKAPLPIAHAAQDMYHSALDNGGDKMTVNHVLDGIVSGALSGGTGLRVGEYDAEEEGNKHQPFTVEELKEPVFKTFVDAGLSMPNTSLSAEEITDEKAGTKKKVSDYPKDVQDDYIKQHKEFLKEELSSIENKMVYVRSYTDAEGKKVSEVSIGKPDKGKYEKSTIEKLSKEEKAQVLSIAQKQATSKAKQKVFGKKSEWK